MERTTCSPKAGSTCRTATPQEHEVVDTAEQGAAAPEAPAAAVLRRSLRVTDSRLWRIREFSRPLNASLGQTLWGMAPAG
mmetsp:Transcript_33951/g.97512  ORF Transcript_33951/g.97512 Transcript_33951/m.97512 type:complete len:80 (+) Transcript_33951:174-413(+)